MNYHREIYDLMKEITKLKAELAEAKQQYDKLFKHNEDLKKSYEQQLAESIPKERLQALKERIALRFEANEKVGEVTELYEVTDLIDELLNDKGEQ